MKLVYKKENSPQVTLAEINGNHVDFLHPTLDRMINHSVTLPAIKIYKEMFGGYQVNNTHKKWGVAVKLFLEFNVINQHPKLFEWINGNTEN